jgi:molybdate transport system substrate-binding protein
MATPAKIKVLSAGAVEGPLEQLVPDFMRESGHHVDIAFNTVGALQARFKSGEKTDVIILSDPAIEALEKTGAFVAESRASLGRATTGVAMRAGASAPDISTPDAFKQTLLRARSVAATDPAAGGSSGIYFAGLLERLGIAADVNRKAVLRPTGRNVAEAVARGEAELGITFISEFLPIKGTQVVGPLPAEMQFTNGYAAAIAATSEAVHAARDFIAFLTRPAGREYFKTFGLEPPAGR